ncbi:GNAT family N-acetyltransferase [Nocardia paucivorans]|uniref:GNAT family N-acetyltransferase n=1 Tax=Nocardia paucivorans TaxID=114259 RepID=UPI0003125B6F|nr:GNAT family N-acetyltransferase [Nocardia paucivorans]
MGTELDVWRAEPSDYDAVVAAFAAATPDEAVTAWIAEGHPIEELITGFVPATVERGLRDGEIWLAGVEGRIWTVSVWQTITSVDRFVTEAAATAEQAEQVPDVRPLQRAAYLTALLAREHPREFPHSYLQVMVTVPEFRSRGAGAAILARQVRALGDIGMPAFLEASTERSARLYARHGFAREGATHTLPENGPTLIPMWCRV